MIDEKTVNRLFDEGFDCSQVVLGEVSERLGMTKEQAYAAAACFGIGMAQGGVCGAATGALIAIGLKYGNTRPGDMAAKDLVFRKRAEFMKRFEEMNGKVNCPDLLGRRIDTLQDLFLTRDSGLYDRCPGYCVNAVRILDEIL